MTDIGTLLYSVLTSVIGNGVWPGEAPDNAVAPYAVYTHFGPANMYLTGPAPEQNQRVQIDLYHNSYAEVQDLSKDVDLAMRAQSMEFSPATFTATPLNFDYFGVDEDVRLHRYMLEYSVWYRPGDTAPIGLSDGGFILLEG